MRRHGTWAVLVAVLGVGAVLATIAVTGGGQRTYLVTRSVPLPSPASSSTRPTVAPTTSSSAVPTTTNAVPTTLAPTTLAPTTIPRMPASTVKPGPADPALAAALPMASELGPGWKALSVGAPPGGKSTWGPCGSPLWSSDTGAAALVLAFDDGTGHEAGATVTLYRAATPEAIGPQHAFTASAQEPPCLESLVAGEPPRYVWLGTLDASEFTESAAHVALPEPGDSELLSVTGTTDGVSRSVLWAFTHEYVGRYEAATEVTWCTCNAPPPATLQQIVDVVGAHVAALAAQSP